MSFIWYTASMKLGTFEAEYKRLNPAQRDAVDSIDGPVMVIAGPGTGKTQVLALRIANLLVKTDIPPSGILCLTFTRSGVSAMRERLEGYIGTRARDVRITTFHSFAIGLVENISTCLIFEALQHYLMIRKLLFWLMNYYKKELGIICDHELIRQNTFAICGDLFRF